ncbi:MAG: acyl-CoA dehydrogenase family protein [Gemmatimonadota bacterium]
MSTTQAPPLPEEGTKRSAPAEVTERETREVVESSRETEWTKPSFAKELFLGRLRMDLIHPYPKPDPEDVRKAQAFMERVRDFLDTVDAERIEREGRVPAEVIEGLRKIGAFGIKIPEEYGGLGLSQRAYGRAISLIGSKSGALAVLLSAHQSIGVPQPLKMFGTPEQKQEYLPRIAAGEISAFALTEHDVGSDPARMQASADPTEDGQAYILNGEKLWCTNGPIADVMVVMARTPARKPGGRRGISAFIVESSWEGVKTESRLEFMGLRGIENGVISFKDVRVPRENLLWGEGKGLKLALITLNTGRLTIPATCSSAGKWCLQVVRRWAAERTQWGAPIGKHDAVAQQIADIAARAFAMEAVADLAASLADAGDYDIRLEAAIAKLFNSECALLVADETMQVRGGRGYETAASLGSRGEAPIPVEQVMRDLRINTIFEGSSEIMRLFIAREALDPHLQRAGSMVQPDSSLGDKAKDAVGLGAHMAKWLAGNVVGYGRWPKHGDFGPLARHIRWADRAASRLARNLGYAMARFGPKLERRQAVLGRVVDIGAELFAVAASCSYALHLDTEPAHELADAFAKGARRRVEVLFDSLFDNDDVSNYRLAQRVLEGRYEFVEEGIVDAPHGDAGA